MECDTTVNLSDEQWMFINGIMLWAKGVLLQGEHLLSIHEHISNTFTNIEKDDVFSNYPHNYKELSDTQRREEDYFILALYNTIYYLLHASHSLAGFKVFYDDLEAVNGVGHIKDIRDMRVHIDEYIKGRGGKQKNNARYVYESPNDIYPSEPFANHLFVADASSTIVFSDAYLIGGRVNVQKTINKLNELLPKIIKLCEKYLYPVIKTDLLC